MSILRIIRKLRERPIFAAIIVSLIAVIIIVGALIFRYGFLYLRIKSTGVSLKPSVEITPRAVTYYLQNDPKWASEPLGASGSTLGGAGCLVSSIASAMSYHGLNYTPQEINGLFTENGVYTENGKVIWMNIKNAIPEMDYEYSRVFDSGTIESLLMEGLLPIIEVKVRGIGISHWVTVIGSDGVDFLIMDPLNQSKTPSKLSVHGNRAYAYRVLIKLI